MQEIYFRNADETEARGPYGIEQMLSLAETGAVTAGTLIYDATSDQWVPLGTNRELMAQVFPEKKKLTLKAKEFKALNTPDTNARAITVDEMLAAAEGRTNETADKKNPDEAMMQAARIGTWAAALSLVASAAGEILPSVPALMSADLAKIIARPLVLLGAVDAAFAVMLLLGMVGIYPLLRFRAAFGFGVIGILFTLRDRASPSLAWRPAPPDFTSAPCLRAWCRLRSRLGPGCWAWQPLPGACSRSEPWPVPRQQKAHSRRASPTSAPGFQAIGTTRSGRPRICGIEPRAAGFSRRCERLDHRYRLRRVPVPARAAALTFSSLLGFGPLGSHLCADRRLRAG
jgi:hypothetical protein